MLKANPNFDVRPQWVVPVWKKYFNIYLKNDGKLRHEEESGFELDFWLLDMQTCCQTPGKTRNCIN